MGWKHPNLARDRSAPDLNLRSVIDEIALQVTGYQDSEDLQTLIADRTVEYVSDLREQPPWLSEAEINRIAETIIRRAKAPNADRRRWRSDRKRLKRELSDVHLRAASQIKVGPQLAYCGTSPIQRQCWKKSARPKARAL
jgi:hypothetical protein